MQHALSAFDCGCLQLLRSTWVSTLQAGTDPVLVSLPQMRNLHFAFELRPEGDYMVSAFNNKRVKVKSSTTNHLVLDLCSTEGLPANLLKILHPNTRKIYQVLLPKPLQRKLKTLSSHSGESVRNRSCGACFKRRIGR